MKVAVVGGNFLGCASAFYVRRALDEERGPAGGGDASPADDIVIFEKRPVLGGNKLIVTQHGPVEVLTGTAADSDVSTLPLFNALLSDAGIEPPPRSTRQSWALFDWEKDHYRLSSQPSTLLSALAPNLIFCLLFHAVLLRSSLFFFSVIRAGHFQLLFRSVDDVYATFIAFWLFFSCAVGFGLVPFPLVARVYNHIIMTHLTDLSAKFAYGPSPAIAGEIAAQFSEHLGAVREHDSAASAITVEHLLARCGLGKYARVSAAELLGQFTVHDTLREHALGPGLGFEYSDSRFTASHVSNGVSAMLSMLSRLPLPTALRARARELSLNHTKTLCPKLAGAARARLHVCAEVLGVARAPDGAYALRVRTSNGERTDGGFDAVVLAAAPGDAAALSVADGILDRPLMDELGLAGAAARADPLVGATVGGKAQRNCARFMTLVAGALRADYFGQRSAGAVADRVAVLNAIDCARVDRVAPGVFRVLSANELDAGSALTKALFSRVDRIASWRRARGPYVATPLRRPSGPDVPNIILARRFLFAAATDRVANHLEMDCLSARNIGSFFKQGVVTWK